MSEPLYAVFAGELAEARKVSHAHLGKIPDIVRESVNSVNKVFPGTQHLDYETVRMDEFLCSSHDPVSALMAAIMLASNFRFRSYQQLAIRCDLRLSIGIAPAELLKKHLRESGGTVFRIADAGLRNMKRNQRLIISTTHEDLNHEFNVSCGFMDILIHDWSDEQAEALFMRLAGKNQMEISKELEISQPAVNRRLKAAHYEAIERMLDRYKQLMTRTIK